MLAFPRARAGGGPDGGRGHRSAGGNIPSIGEGHVWRRSLGKAGHLWRIRLTERPELAGSAAAKCGGPTVVHASALPALIKTPPFTTRISQAGYSRRGSVRQALWLLSDKQSPHSVAVNFAGTCAEEEVRRLPAVHCGRRHGKSPEVRTEGRDIRAEVQAWSIVGGRSGFGRWSGWRRADSGQYLGKALCDELCCPA